MVVVLHGGFFQDAVAALDLAISAGMSRFGEVVPDAVLVVQAFENTLPGITLLKCYRNVCDPLSISYFINLAGHCRQCAASIPYGLRLQPGEGQLTGVVSGHK